MLGEETVYESGFHTVKKGSDQLVSVGAGIEKYMIRFSP